MAKNIEIPTSGGTKTLSFSGTSSACINSYNLNPSSSLPSWITYSKSTTGSNGTYTFNIATRNTGTTERSVTFNATVGELSCSNLEVRVYQPAPQQPSCDCAAGVSFETTSARVQNVGGIAEIDYSTGTCLSGSVSVTIPTSASSAGWAASADTRTTSIIASAPVNTENKTITVPTTVSWQVPSGTSLVSCSQVVNFIQDPLTCTCNDSMLFTADTTTHLSGDTDRITIQYSPKGCVEGAPYVSFSNPNWDGTVVNGTITVRVSANEYEVETLNDVIVGWSINDGSNIRTCSRTFTYTQNPGNCSCNTSIAFSSDTATSTLLPTSGGSINIPYTAETCVARTTGDVPNIRITSSSAAWSGTNISRLSGSFIRIQYPANTSASQVLANITAEWDILPLSGGSTPIDTCSKTFTLKQAPKQCYNIDMPLVIGASGGVVIPNLVTKDCSDISTYTIVPDVNSNQSCGGDITFTLQ